MNKRANDDRPPSSTDLEGWRRAIKDGKLRGYRMEDIVAAIQDLGPHTDKDVLHDLAKHFSDALLGILRQRISVDHPNRGEDIIFRAYDQIVDAVLRPGSADGKGLRLAFIPRVNVRIIDAIRKEVREARKPGEESKQTTGPDAECDGEQTGLAGLAVASDQPDESWKVAEHIDVERILERVSDDRKRLAFRLHMDGIPLRSTKSASIAKALGISAKTAGEWVKEVQVLLSSDPNVQKLMESKSKG